MGSEIDEIRRIFQSHRWRYRDAIIRDLISPLKASPGISPDDEDSGFHLSRKRALRSRWREHPAIMTLNLYLQDYSLRCIGRFCGITHQGAKKRLDKAIAMVKERFGDEIVNDPEKLPMQITLTLQAAFDAAHLLPSHPGKCSRLHGHRWKVEAEFKGKLDRSTGMLLDFSILKEIISSVLPDHSYLNDEIKNPTAELLAVKIFGDINRELMDNKIESAKLTAITIWESEHASARYSP